MMFGSVTPFTFVIFAMIMTALLPVADFLPQPRSLPGFLSQFILEGGFQNSKIFLVYGDFFQDNQSLSPSSQRWLDLLEEMISQRELISKSGGVTNFHMRNSNFTVHPVKRPETVKEFDVAHLVLLVIPAGIKSRKEEEILNERLNLPLLQPPTLRDLDKYIIATEKRELPHLNNKVELIKKLKFKLFLTEGSEEEEGMNVVLRQFCPYCPIQEKVFSELKEGQLHNYFPDLQLNYFGFVLRASSTDKMEGDLEFALDPRTGKKYAKRGVFASAMYHLAEGLNFTAEPYPSSAGASTGHRLANGTWVGSVGDVYNGDASFCLLCGMSYSRHSFVEICSPVTYEYIRFAIGPPDKLYTWEAIFWPFDRNLWGAILLSTLVITLASASFLKWDESNRSNWDAFKVSQYLGKIFIEQVDDLPLGLPQSLKVMLGFWLLFALVGTTIYRAKMVTFMTFPIYEKVPLTYEELIGSNNYEIKFHYFPNIAYNSFKSSTNPVIKATFDRMLKQPDPIKCLQHTLSSKSVCIMFTSVHEDLLSRNMSDRFGISPIRSSSNYAFMFTPGISSQKRAPFTRNFRHILQTSLAMGLNEWWSRSDAYFLLKQKNAWMKTIPPGGNKTGVFQYANEDDGGDVLHLRHLKGAFTVVVGGLLGCLAAFIAEQSMYIFGRITRVKERWERTVELARRKNLGVGSGIGVMTLKTTTKFKSVVHFVVSTEGKDSLTLTNRKG